MRFFLYNFSRLTLAFTLIISTCQAQSIFSRNYSITHSVSATDSAFCGEPGNLTGVFVNPEQDPCQLQLTWDIPVDPEPDTSNWLAWDNGENFTGVGLSAGGTFYAAVRFTPNELKDYPGYALTRIRFHFSSDTGSVTLKVWTGENGTKLVRSQKVDSLKPLQWCDIPLDTPYVFNHTEELWIGFEVTHPSGTYPAGSDAGPAVAHFGDLISLDGKIWESMSESYNLDFNFNLRGFVTNGNQQVELNQRRFPYRYDIYRNTELIGNSEVNSFTDNNAGFPYPCYQVKAIYSDCESVFSNTFCIPVEQDLCNLGINEIPSDEIEIYPNPASSVISISVNSINISEIIVTDQTGRIVKSCVVNPSNPRLVMDISTLPEGFYVIKFTDDMGRTGAKKLIVTGS